MSDATTETEQAAEDEAPQPAPDPVRDELAQKLAADLGDDLLDTVVERGDIWIRVANGAWRRTFELLRDRHDFTFFSFLSGLDWLRSPVQSTRYEQVYQPAPEAEASAAESGDTADETVSADTAEGETPAEQASAAESGETAEEPAPEQTGSTYETGVAGGDTRFQVFARVYDPDRKIGITVKADLDEDNPTVETITPLYRGADWHERETWEMFGFVFDGHPGLRHLYLPTEFEGFPLRKDFPLLAREVKPWPGLVDVEPIPAHLMPSGDEGGEAAS